MGPFDSAIVAVYFIVVIGLGFWYQKRASRDLESYFLGGKQMHWLALAMSGSVSNFDITGTMWIVSMLYLMGMRSMWIHWMWGWMMGAFFLAYMGKWVRRSKVMTGAEWMVTRFGEGPGGTAARMAAALMAVITLCGMIGYAFQGIGKFAHEFVPALSPNALAFIIIGTTTFYVLLGGLHSVVVTDVIQTVIVTFAAIVIAVVAYTHLSPDAIGAALPSDWASLMPKWRLTEFAGTDNAGYELFGALVLVWVAKGLLLNAGGPGGMYDFQRFLAARDSRDAAKIGAAWSVFMVVRWGMTMGITLLALADLGLTGAQVAEDSETVMPIVLHEYLGPGVQGLVIAGLLAAFMSTFSSTVNSGASYLVRDFWQPYFRPRADEHHLVRAGYVATIAIVLAGIAIGLQAKSIAQIWEWLMTALGAGIIVPNILRWYWWRMNGWGYAAGTVAGMALACIPLYLSKYHGMDLPMYAVFPPVVIGSFVACIVGTFVSRPVDHGVLLSFYRSVRPFGMWGPVRREVAPQDDARDGGESGLRTVANVVLGMVAIMGFYLFPMYLVGHWHAYAGICFVCALAATVALRFTWWPYLPAPSEP